MKAEISNYGFRRQEHYSGVYQQQGRMLTDRDWNDFAEIVKHRLDTALDRVVKSGAPRGGGLLDLDGSTEAPDGTYEVDLRTDRGWVVVDGIVAELLPAENGNDFSYDKQADFPDPPSLIEDMPLFLYVDVWERPVLSLEDDELREPALHGADTCFRTQTMAQIKYCRAVGGDPLIGECHDPVKNPQIGTAQLDLELRADNVTPDECDPCAKEIRLDETVGNYLFRLEVHDVTYDGASRDPTEITLKWASDNAGTQYAVGGAPVDFGTGGYVYEYYSDATEKYLGVHLVPAAEVPAPGGLVEEFSELSTEPVPPAPSYAYVRRWDGYCILQKDAAGWKLGEDGDAALGIDRGVRFSTTSDAEDHGHVAFDGAGVTINLNALTLKLTLGDKRFVRGDYWLALARERAAESDKIKILSNDQKPIGISHHYLVLGQFDGQSKIIGLSDEDRRRLTFPPLTDITARDVGYETDCPSGLFDDSHNTVEKALNRICSIGAGHIGFSKPCDTSVYKGVPTSGLKTVEDALKLLCDLRAEQIGFKADPDCEILQDTGNVRDALNALCQRPAGAGCKATVGKGGEFKDVASAIQVLLKRGAEAICLCLLPGDHAIPPEFGLDNRDVSISIVGCGRHATRIVLKNKPFVLGLRAFALKDVGMLMADQASFLFVTADALSIDSCAVVGRAETAPLVVLDARERLHLADNVVVVHRPKVFDQPKAAFRGFPKLAGLFVFADRHEFRKQAHASVKAVAEASANRRVTLARRGAKAVQDQSRADPRRFTKRQFDSYMRAFADLQSATVDEDTLVADLDNVSLAAFEAGPATAIAILTARADTLFDNNDITGIVAFFGAPGVSGLSGNQLTGLKEQVCERNDLTMDTTERTLNMRNNHMTRLVVGGGVIKELLKISQGGTGSVPPMFRTALLSDNVLTMPDNHFLALHHSLSATHFEFQRFADAGFVFGQTAVYMGCHGPSDLRAPGPLRLFSCTRGQTETATLDLNIV